MRRYLRQRRSREAAFPAGLFGDPAWDIILELFASDIEGRCVTVSNACDAAAVPSSTALRSVDKLVELGCVQRVACRTDRRVVHLRLMSETRRVVERWLADTFP